MPNKSYYRPTLLYEMLYFFDLNLYGAVEKEILYLGWKIFIGQFGKCPSAIV